MNLIIFLIGSPKFILGRHNTILYHGNYFIEDPSAKDISGNFELDIFFFFLYWKSNRINSEYHNYLIRMHYMISLTLWSLKKILRSKLRPF